MKLLGAVLAAALTALLIIIAFVAAVLWFRGLEPNAGYVIAAVVVTASLWYTIFGAFRILLK
jgi:hypothetical protein